MNSIKLYCDRCTDAALVAHDIHTKHRRWLSCDRPSRYLLQTECNWQAIGICSFAVASPELVQKELGLLYAAATLESNDGRWLFTLFGDNLTDETYIISGASNIPQFGLVVATYARPRTWGLSVRYRFGDHSG